MLRTKGISKDMIDFVMDLNRNVEPPYLADKHTWEKYDRSRTAIEYACMIRSVAEKIRQEQEVKTWSVQKAKRNEWKRKSMDDRLIYNLNADVLEEPEDLREAASRPSSPVLDYPRENIDKSLEKNVIHESKARQRTPINMTVKRLMDQTMREFNKPKDVPQAGYCTPKSKYLAPEPQDASEAAHKYPYQVVRNFPTGISRWARKHDSTICQRELSNRTASYCDVLGAHTCTKCIEITNRRIISEIQKETFPTLEFSVNNLVATKLSKEMRKGEFLQSRTTTRDGSCRPRSKVSLPIVQSAKARDFKRAGIEKDWYERAKTFHEGGGRQETGEDGLEASRASNTLSSGRARKPKHKSRLFTNRTIGFAVE